MIDHPTPEWEAWVAQRWRERHNLPTLSDEEARKRFFAAYGLDGWYHGQYVGSEQAVKQYAEDQTQNAPAGVQALLLIP